MTEATPEPDDTGAATADPDGADEQSSADGDGVQPLTADDYSQGRTSEPDGASRDEPAGEDYAGSGF